MTVQASNFEGARGMYEAYGRNKYSALGITTWKYDAAWPAALTWAYIDWYLLPTAAYYGAKKACQPLHVQYSYDDDSVWAINGQYREYQGLKVSARVVNLDMSEKLARAATVDLGPDGKAEAFKLEWPRDLSRSYFLKLELRDAEGKLLDDNFYWLSTSREKPGERYYGVAQLSPSSYSDFTPLRTLPRARLEASCRPEAGGPDRELLVTIKNPGATVAFLVQVAAVKGAGGMEIAPSYWSDNFVSLLPGEEKTLRVKYAESDLEGKAPVVRVSGWNLDPVECVP
jgi:exo-1,4-beta-D-glucosaminidase